MTADLTAWIVVILLTEEVIRRLPAARRNPRGRTLWLVFLALDLSMITEIQIVGDLLHQATTIDEAATLTKHVFGIAAVAFLLRWVAGVVPGRMEGRHEPTYRKVISSNPRRILTWIVIGAHIAIFPLAQRREGNQPDTDFIFLQAGHFWGSLHLILFYAYLVFGLVCASTMCAAAAREPSAHGAFKHGMQTFSLGCVLGSLYGIVRSGYLTARLFDKPFLGGDGFVDTTSRLFLVGSILLIVCGAAAPKWEQADHLVKAHSAVNDLRPLWATLTSAVPSVLYTDATTRPGLLGRLHDFWSWRRLDARLRRRITEICDASFHLAPYVPPTLCDRTTEAADALNLPSHVVSAYLLHTAILRKQAGESPCDGPAVPILTAGSSHLDTTARLLPVGQSMTNPQQMEMLDRKLSAKAP